MATEHPAALYFPEGPALTEPHLQWHVSNFFPNDSIVAAVPFRHHPTTPWHDHDFFELALIESGRGTHESEAGAIPLHAGIAILLPPGAGHEYRACEGMRVYNCLFRAELMDSELMWARRDGLLGPLFDPSRSTAGERPTTLVDLGPAEVRRVIEVLEPIRTGDAPTRAAQLARLLLALDAIAGAAALERPFGWTADTSPAVTDAVELLSSDLAHPWTLDELSRRVYTGRFHLAHAFARAVGQPPMQYLAGLRAERAAALLSSTDLPIAVVGTEVGWPDPAYFSRRFRAAFGISPRDYRRLRSSAAHEAETAIKDVQEFGKRGQVAV